jgi:HD superfamily phosphohydrolase
MTDKPMVQFTFAVNDPELEDAERQEIARKLLRELRQLDEVENVDFAKDSELEPGARSVLATLVGVLTAEVSIENIQKVLGFIGDRMPNKPVVIKVKVGEQEVEIEAKSRKELEDAERVVRQLLAQMQEADDA